MPVVSYPGIYVEEAAGGLRTITGIDTSIAAFVGWAPKGPIDQAELVLSWPEFSEKFGGFDQRSFLGYAVAHFFANGGERAYIVRLAMSGSVAAADNIASAKVTIDGKLRIIAKNPGAWANYYAVAIKRYSAPDDSRFQLKVLELNQYGTGSAVEVFEDLSVNQADGRYVCNILNYGSSFVGAKVLDEAADPPADTVISATGVIPVANRLAGGADGKVMNPNDAAFETSLMPMDKTGGVYHLDQVELFNLLCVPGESKPSVLADLQKFCRDRRAFLIADRESGASFSSLQNGPDNGLTGNDVINAALYFPWVVAADPLQENQLRAFPPCGFVAGVYARTDSRRGVWKAPAGTDAGLAGAVGVSSLITDVENGVLNPNAVNCIRTLPVYGTVVWGSRTLQGKNKQNSEWKYIPVRRMALFLEESLYRALKWVVFEPNAEPLWAQIRVNVDIFMQELFHQQAFQGMTPRDAYFVKCDNETTTQNDINMGIVNIIVGFAPLKPAEFIIIKIRQLAGRVQP